MRSFLLLLLLAPVCASAVESTPEQAVSALWSALSNEPGARADTVTLERLFHEDAVIFGGGYKEGTPTVRRSTAKDFLTPYQRAGEKGFHECEISRAIQAYDRFAMAYSIVESRTDKTATAPDFIGVNSIQLYKVGSQWKILSLYYHVEKQGLPVPLDGGRSGKCVA